MRRWIVTAAGIAAVAGAAGLAAQPEEDDGRAQVELIGLQVVKPLKAGQREQPLTGHRTGTTLMIQVTRRDRHWLGLDPGASRLEAFVDDRGRELVDDGIKALGTWLDGQTWVSDDGQTCVFEALATATPSPQARRVGFKGLIGLKFGRNPAMAEQANFALDKDSRLKAGPVDMKITGVQRGDNTTIFTLSTKSKPERISRIQFLDADGKEFETKVLDKAVVGFMGETYHDWTYAIKTDKPRLVESVTARVLYFHKVQTLVVPVSISAGIGL